MAANPVWYHTIELAPGVLTPGHVDLRSVASKVLPDDLDGLRALDVGAFDGFWGFEMERRGAEVIAIDVEKLDDAEWPPQSRERLKRESEELGVELGRGWQLAADSLGSNAQRVVCNIYDLGPNRIGGEVDFVFSGAILLHLRDPIRGLERIRSALRPGAELRMFEPFSIGLTLRSPRRPAAQFSPLDTPFNWWLPNLATLSAWPRVAAFEPIRRVAIVRPPSVREMRYPYAVLSCRRPR